MVLSCENYASNMARYLTAIYRNWGFVQNTLLEKFHRGIETDFGNFETSQIYRDKKDS